MTIVVVDDDAGIRQLLTMFLEHKGYTALGFTNGLEALTFLQHNPDVAQLILLDVMMPVMDGAAFRQAQHQDPHLAAIPVIVMSAAADMAEQAPLLRAAA
jgi:CheY-like chemotaxis protein